jgi:hypothetical protein
VATKPATPKAASETESVEAPVLDEAGVDADVFTWEPKAGGEPIVLPHGSKAVPKDKHFWFAYQMNKRNFVGQIMFALECAGVPDAVQERVFELGDDEALELVNAWAKDIGGASVGES